MEELESASAVELGALMREGQVSPLEVTEAALRRIEAEGNALGAFVEVDAERALADARAVDADDRRVFAGVPIAIKANTMAAGWTMDYGSSRLAGHRADHDAHVVRRLRDEGFVIVGITNMPEFGILPTTEPAHRAPARNPLDPSRTPGGSSGGAAAAVAAGLLPIAHGNDGGGSLRIPAACCGLIGLKPSRGRISRGPDAGDSFLVCDGVLTRTVLDTAAALDAMSGYEAGDATWAPPPDRAFSAAFHRDPGRLRIGVAVENPLAPDPDPRTIAPVTAVAELLAELGHEVQETSPRLPGPETLPLFTAVFGANVALSVAHAAALGGTDGPVEPLTQTMIDGAGGAVGYLGALALLQRLSRDVVAGFAAYDVLLTPALAQRPPEIGAITGADPAAFDRAVEFAPWAGLFNVTGQPALSFPLGLGDDGLPLAVQLVGRPLGEDTLLQVAAQLEDALRPQDLADGEG